MCRAPPSVDLKDTPLAAPHKKEPELSWFTAFTTYFAYALLIAVGHLRDFVGRWSGITRWKSLLSSETTAKGYAPLFQSWENFYTRRLYYRIQDVFNRPICSSPSAWIDVQDRKRDEGELAFELTGGTTRCLNLGSYNYLGFADDWMSTCGEHVLDALERWPVGCASSRVDVGTTAQHEELEALVADFIGKEAAIVFNMGYGTNSTTIPALAGSGSLIISDTFNHSSIVNGARASGAMVRTFAHNDAADLARVLREAIALGRPRTRRPWTKILVMVEGIYSMEGEICNLAAIAKVCKAHRAYLYLDEAHSIGALGASGRGACEHCGVDPADVDVLMGTFTKSFGGMGGYIASSRATIEHLRSHCSGIMTHNAMSPIVCAQIIRSFKVIQGADGSSIGADKLAALRDNSNYFRSELEALGLHVYGDYDSPVIPVLLYNPTKIAAFSRECLKRGLAVVTVGFPATPIIKSRARFCVSAGHKRSDLEIAIRTIKEVAELCKLQYSVSAFG